MLNKAIQHGKEYRKPYRGAKAVDYTCKNHGSDTYACKARMFRFKKDYLQKADSSIDDTFNPEELTMSELREFAVKQLVKPFTKLANFESQKDSIEDMAWELVNNMDEEELFSFIR